MQLFVMHFPQGTYVINLKKTTQRRKWVAVPETRKAQLSFAQKHYGHSSKVDLNLSCYGLLKFSTKCTGKKMKHLDFIYEK